MKKFKTLIKKLLSSSFIIGFVGLFNPMSYDYKTLPLSRNKDIDNLKSDWEAVGSYIRDAYQKEMNNYEGRR